MIVKLDTTRKITDRKTAISPTYSATTHLFHVVVNNIVRGVEHLRPHALNTLQDNVVARRSGHITELEPEIILKLLQLALVSCDTRRDVTGETEETRL